MIAVGNSNVTSSLRMTPLNSAMNFQNMLSIRQKTAQAVMSPQHSETLYSIPHEDFPAYRQRTFQLVENWHAGLSNADRQVPRNAQYYGSSIQLLNDLEAQQPLLDKKHQIYMGFTDRGQPKSILSLEFDHDNKLTFIQGVWRHPEHTGKGRNLISIVEKIALDEVGSATLEAQPLNLDVTQFFGKVGFTQGAAPESGFDNDEYMHRLPSYVHEWTLSKKD